MNMRVWALGHGQRKSGYAASAAKFYKAESDMWQVIRNVLGSREAARGALALGVLGEASAPGRRTRPLGRRAATGRYYLDRIGDLQTFFQFAQLALPCRPRRRQGSGFRRHADRISDGF